MTAPDANLTAGEILIVNETYVRQQPVLDQEGRRYLPAASAAKTSQFRPVRVIIPPSVLHFLSTSPARLPRAGCGE
ncbi:hypothetical protein, partial [Streptomyces sp. NPDC004788]